MISPLSNYMPLYIRESLPTSARRIEGAPQLGNGGVPEAAGAGAEATVGAQTPRPVTAADDPSSAENQRRPSSDGGTASPSTPRSADSEKALSEEEQAEVRGLKTRDAEVRRHEQAHAAAGGAHSGGPQFEYQRGPDGRQYAVEGHVTIDVGEVRGDAEATVQKMRQVQRAALAPAQPSGQDRKVAAQAAAKAAKAQREVQASSRAANVDAPERASETNRSKSGAAEGAVGDAAFAGISSIALSSAGPARFSSSAAGAQAYAAATGAEPSQTLSLVACGNCGSAHSA